VIGNFYGNTAIVAMLEQMLAAWRIPQTMLFAGPEGIGKATLVRRFAAALMGEANKIERDDLSLPQNDAYVAEREKLPAEKRSDDPLLFASHPDFITFPPDGPLRQISIQQMRLLKERAQFKPLHGRYRVFLVDHIDRANEQAANSLLKILEEPPPHLILILTAENAYDLLPTIRSRSLIFQFAPLSSEETLDFLRARGLPDIERRAALAAGCPGSALSLDLALYERRRQAMLSLLRSASGKAPFGDWVKFSESMPAARSEKLDAYIRVLYLLLEDILFLQQGFDGPVRNIDIRPQLEELAALVSFGWLRTAVKQLDELVEMSRRNIQKTIALDALVLNLSV
jgi:DNA polymerase-3 subunit delta'